MLMIWHVCQIGNQHDVFMTTSKTCGQHICSSTSVTNINLTHANVITINKRAQATGWKPTLLLQLWIRSSHSFLSEQYWPLPKKPFHRVCAGNRAQVSHMILTPSFIADTFVATKGVLASGVAVAIIWWWVFWMNKSPRNSPFWWIIIKNPTFINIFAIKTITMETNSTLAGIRAYRICTRVTEQKFSYSKVIKDNLACTMSKFGANVKGFVTFINISACNTITTKSISTFTFITSFCIFTSSMSRATWSTKFTLVDIWASITFKSIITFALKASDTVYALWYVYRAYWSERWFWAFVDIFALFNVVILSWVQALFLWILKNIFWNFIPSGSLWSRAHVTGEFSRKTISSSDSFLIANLMI